MKEAATPAFKKYGHQIVKNAKALAAGLTAKGLTLTTGGTDSHLIVIDLRKEKVIGNIVAEALEVANIVANYNTVPHDTNPPMYPSGVRLGTPILTTRGMKEEDMKTISAWIYEVVCEVSHYRLPEAKEERSAFVKQVKVELWKNKNLLRIGREVKLFARKFPVP
jgi:glycine hydroxymethyltransferase